ENSIRPAACACCAAEGRTMRKHLIPLVALAACAGCDDGGSNVLGGVPAIVYLQRTVQATGNVFEYAGGGTNGNLWKLTPPTASGERVNLTNWVGGDVNALDLSFDAREVVFSGRRPGDDNYHIYRITVDGMNPCDAAKGKDTVGPCQITEGPNDQVYPVEMPRSRLMFVSNDNVEGPGMPQFQDEYERARTAQVASSNLDGGDILYGPRNVSHRVAPSLMSDGRI